MTTWKKPGAVVVCSRESAQRYLNATATKRDINSVVSLGGTRPHGLDRIRIPDDRKLVMDFEDVEREATKEEIACGIGFKGPTFHDVVRIRDFLSDYGPWFCFDLNRAVVKPHHGVGTLTRLLFHCEQGISRSAAAALIGFAMFVPNKDAQLAVEMLIEHSEESVDPNKLMVRFADDLLEYRGGLITAVDKMWGKSPGGIFVPRAS